MAIVPCTPDIPARSDQAEKHRKYVKRWHVDRKRGVSRALVDASTVREHIGALVDEGWPVKAIARAAGVSDTSLRDLLAGRTAGTRQAVARAACKVNRRMLYRLAKGEDPVPAVGFTRRVQALQSIGYTYRQLESLGICPDIGPVGRHVDANRWRRCVAAYDELWDKPGPSQRARLAAARRGCAPPLAWDDDTIDDPAAVPDLGERADRRQSLLEDVEWLLANGHGWLSAPGRLGMNAEALERALSRAGRADLSRALKATDRAS